jgi:tRNA (adenine57-N1/adenine58-N1)-methyltransferase
MKKSSIVQYFTIFQRKCDKTNSRTLICLMSIIDFNRKVAAFGDIVCIWASKESVVPLKLEQRGVLHNKYGMFRHEDFAGKPFGSRVAATKGGSGWVYLLQPTPELWTRSLPHRTQIIYEVDISLITFYLDLKRGDVVFESGTGTGSLSTAIARSIAPNGKLFTFDINIDRVHKAT